MPRSGPLRVRSICDSCAPITSVDASVEPPSTTIYSLSEKPCAITLQIVSSSPAALFKLIVMIVKSGSDRAIEVPARALSPDNLERRSRYSDLARDLSCILQERRKVEGSQITWN